MADEASYDVSSSFPASGWFIAEQSAANDDQLLAFPGTLHALVEQNAGNDDQLQALPSDNWKEGDGVSYFEPPILSSITADTGGGGATVDGGRANPLCPRANP